MINMTNQAWLLAASEQLTTAEQPPRGIPETYYKRYNKSQLMRAKGLPLNFDLIKDTYNGQKIKYPVYLLSAEGARVTADVQTNIDGNNIRTYWRKGCAIGVEFDPNKETFEDVDLVVAFPVKRRMKPRQVVQKLVHSGLIEHVCTKCKDTHYTEAPLSFREAMEATLCLQGIHSMDKPVSWRFTELELLKDYSMTQRTFSFEAEPSLVRFYKSIEDHDDILAVVLEEGLDDTVMVKAVLPREQGDMLYHMPVHEKATVEEAV